MTKCAKCQKSVSRTVMVVTQVRMHDHPKRCDSRGHIIDEGGTGTQIVREERRCLDCAAQSQAA